MSNIIKDDWNDYMNPYNRPVHRVNTDMSYEDYIDNTNGGVTFIDACPEITVRDRFNRAGISCVRVKQDDEYAKELEARLIAEQEEYEKEWLEHQKLVEFREKQTQKETEKVVETVAETPKKEYVAPEMTVEEVPAEVAETVVEETAAVVSETKSEDVVAETVVTKIAPVIDHIDIKFDMADAVKEEVHEETAAEEIDVEETVAETEEAPVREFTLTDETVKVEEPKLKVSAAGKTKKIAAAKKTDKSSETKAKKTSAKKSKK